MPTNAEIAAFRLANELSDLMLTPVFPQPGAIQTCFIVFKIAPRCIFGGGAPTFVSRLEQSAGLIHAFESAPGIGHTGGRNDAVTGGAGAAMDAGAGSGANLANPRLHRQVRYPG